MNDLLVLVKILSAVYQAKKLKDANLLSELVDTLNDLPNPPGEVFSQEKEVKDSIKATIHWLLKQSDDEPVIKSMLEQRCLMFCKNDDLLKEAIKLGLEDIDSDEATRRLIYKHITDIRVNSEGEAFSKKFKNAIKNFYFKDVEDMEREDWANLIDLVQERVNSTYEENQSEVVCSVNTATPDSFKAVIELAKKESSKEGIMLSPFQGINQGLEPDGGFKRSKMYMLEALTNRGKSFTISHLAAGIGMYNKPMLRDKAKIPTIIIDSAEDTMSQIVMRMFKLAMEFKKDPTNSFLIAEEETIIEAIASMFKVNGWYLVINQIDPSKDSAPALFARVRSLELKGHEIIAYFYDYLGLQNLDKIPGDSKSDKLQLLFRKVRAFIIARGICFITPHQLSPEAKRKLQESDEESEVYFIKEVTGKSLTETSTKITNEVDVVIGIHVAKTSFKNYWTFGIGKQRGEGCSPEKRFGIYDIDEEKGLQHDVLGKPAFRRNLQTRINENGDIEKTWDAL